MALRPQQMLPGTKHGCEGNSTLFAETKTQNRDVLICQVLFRPTHPNLFFRIYPPNWSVSFQYTREHETHARAHINCCIYTNMRTHARKRTHTHTHRHSLSHTHTHIHTHTHMRAHTHTYTHTLETEGGWEGEFLRSGWFLESSKPTYQG